MREKHKELKIHTIMVAVFFFNKVVLLVYWANVTLNLLQTTACKAVCLVTIDDYKFTVIFNDNDDKNYSVVNYRFIVFHCSVAMDGCVHNHNSNACTCTNK